MKFTSLQVVDQQELAQQTIAQVKQQHIEDNTIKDADPKITGNSAGSGVEQPKTDDLTETKTDPEIGNSQLIQQSQLDET